jgi:hypothetical protein
LTGSASSLALNSGSSSGLPVDQLNASQASIHSIITKATSPIDTLARAQNQSAGPFTAQSSKFSTFMQDAMRSKQRLNADLGGTGGGIAPRSSSIKSADNLQSGSSLSLNSISTGKVNKSPASPVSPISQLISLGFINEDTRKRVRLAVE